MIIDNAIYQSDLSRILSGREELSSFLSNKSILVVGATGLIGSCLVDTLMKLNLLMDNPCQIYAMSRNIERLAKRFSPYMNRSYFHVIEGDVTKEIDIDEDIDYIIHGASNTHPKAYATDPIGTIMTNIKGTENLLNFALKSHCQRTLFLSSVEVYGTINDDSHRIKEEDFGYIDCNSLRAGYPESKRVSEALCQAYIEKYDLDIVIPRLCRVYGPTVLSTDSKASTQFISRAVNGEDIILKSEGNQYFSYLYVVDVVSALLLLLQRGEKGKAYNVAHSQFDLRLKELATHLAKIAHRDVIFELPDQVEAKGYSKANVAIIDSTKIENLGFHSQFKLYETLEHTVQIIKEISEI